MTLKMLSVAQKGPSGYSLPPRGVCHVEMTTQPCLKLSFLKCCATPKNLIFLLPSYLVPRRCGGDRNLLQSLLGFTWDSRLKFIESSGFCRAPSGFS